MNGRCVTGVSVTGESVPSSCWVRGLGDGRRHSRALSGSRVDRPLRNVFNRIATFQLVPGACRAHILILEIEG